MKKILLSACIISFTYNLHAQCDNYLPISEDFGDTSEISVCWNFIDNDGDGHNWYPTDVSGSKYLVSESYTDALGYLTPDNWAISQMIDLTSYSPSSSITLNWKIRARDWSFDQERYSVYVATGNQIADFTASPITVFENLDNTDASGAWGNRSLDISVLAGNTVYIAFRHWASVFQDQINLDDMFISGTLGVNDFDVNSFKHFYNADSDNLTLKSNISLDTIEIYNILGQQVLHKNLSQTEEVINLSTLKDGLYIAQVKVDNAIQTIKFLKQ